MAGLEEGMKRLLQPSYSPGVGGSSLGCCLGVVLLSDRRWWQWLFLQWAKGDGASRPLAYRDEGRWRDGLWTNCISLLGWIWRCLWSCCGFGDALQGSSGCSPSLSCAAWPWCLGSPRILSCDGGGFNSRDFKTWAASPCRSAQGWRLLCSPSPAAGSPSVGTRTWHGAGQPRTPSCARSRVTQNS